MRRLTFTAFSAVVLLVSSGAGVASAHFLGEDSVDGNEIRYEDYSRWDDSHVNAEREWEGLVGGVNIAPDSITTIADLELRDYSANDGLCGYWDGRTGADLLRLNNSYYNGATTTNRRACTLHEWGHAHGLAHSFNDQVMDDCPVSACGSVYTTPQAHDRADYYAKW
jgi:hypothetical protein